MKVLAMIAVAGMATTAMARPGATGHIGSSLDTMTSIDGLSRGTTNFTTSVSFDTTANDPQGAANNVVIEVNVGANNQVTALGFDVDIETIGPSWLSEVVFYFDNSTQDSPVGVFLTPAPGDGMPPAAPQPSPNPADSDQPGFGNYSSGGLVDLTDAGLPGNIQINADGILRIEIFDTYNDFPGAPDANVSGTLTIGLLEIPAPGAVALFGLGGLAAARRRR